ncbi:MAG: HAMP domain-containing sensor histidine kinase [Vulcanimicrobiota bacterium]
MAWAALLIGTLVGFGLLGSPAGLKPDQSALVWAGCGLLLELASPKLPRFGFCATAAGLWLALAARFPQLAWLAVLGSGLGLLLRIGRTSQSGTGGMLEALADLQPLALALGVGRAFGQPWLACLIWWLFYWLQPVFLTRHLEEEMGRDWARLRARLARVALATACLGALAALLPADRSAAPLLLALALWLLASTAGSVQLGVDAENREIKGRQQQRGLQQREKGLDVREQGLRAEGRKQALTAAELEVRLQTYQLVDEMLESIPSRLAFQAVGQMIVQRLQARFTISNVVLFWDEKGALTPVAWATAHSDRVTSAQLTQRHEPILLEAIKTGRLKQEQGSNASANRLFPEDQWSLALPLPGRGGFYLGNEFLRQLGEEDLHFLEVLARHSVLALDAAAWYQTLQTSLQREAATAARNEALVQRLALVIDGVTQLIRLRDARGMLERAAEILAPVIPHEAYLGRSVELGVFQGQADRQALEALAVKVTEQGLPLLLENPHRLAVPLLSDQGAQGALVLERADKPFSREDQDILAVLSYQLGSAIVSAKLFEELQKTHAALRDSQAQLMQSSKMAAVGQLAGGVAHELNTPLGAVALAIEAAQMNLESKPDRALQRLQRATKAVGQMKEIVSKLLFYSRDARTGWRETSVNQVIEDTLQMVGHQLRLDNVEVLQQLGEVPNILANANELQQVLTNLILNARDAMLMPGAQGRRLMLSSGRWEQGVWVKVRDQGSGMSPEVLEKIFDPFFTTKDVGKGTGLGLSVTSQLIQQHGGSIKVHSQPGQGTEFEVRLLMSPTGEAA